MKTIDESRLIVLLFLWGDHFIEMLEKYCLSALLQPGNLGTWPGNVHFLIYTKAEKADRIQELAAKSLSKSSARHEIIVLPEPHPDHPHFGLHATRAAIRRSLEWNCRLLWLTPDMIFGNGSIQNMLAYAQFKPVSVAAIDLRCEWRQMDGRGLQTPVSNAELVSLALSIPHQCTTSAIDGTGCWTSGVSIVQLPEAGLWSVVHKIPTPYLCYFTEDDSHFFDNWKEGIGVWDHVWPSRLVSSGRFRFVASSDMAFVLHLTDQQHALTPVGEPCFTEEFAKSQHHHDVAGSLVGLLRENL